MLSQNEFLRNFTDKERLDFNDELFIRDEDEIVTELMKVILSAQRDNPIFTILVDSFTLTEDYETIVPFQLLQTLGYEVDAVCPDKKEGDII